MRGAVVWTVAAVLKVAAVLIVAPALARAQDFLAPAPGGVPSGVFGTLDRALPTERSDPRLETLAVRWHGLSELGGGALALGGGWRALRVAGGLARLGVAGLGWDAAGVALGTATRAGGAAVRVTARRDQADSSIVAPASGFEAGAGAWVRAGRARLWASSPQLARRGAPPPLLRGLEVGGDLPLESVTLWFTHSTKAYGGAAGAGGEAGRTRAAGVALTGDAFAIWIEARDRPRRASLGVMARAGAIGVAAAVESHPVLAETVRIAIEFAPARGRR